MLRIIDSIKLEVSSPGRADKLLTQSLKTMNPFMSRQIIDEWFDSGAFSLKSRVLKADDFFKNGIYTISVDETHAARLACTELAAWHPDQETGTDETVDANTVARTDENTRAKSSAKKSLLVFDHPDFFILEKPSGIPSVPHAPWESRSVVQLGLHFFPEWASSFDIDSLELGLAHRLDEGTSGLMICAKSKPVLEKFRELFRTGAIEKTYTAYTLIPVEPQTVREEIVALKKSKKRMRLASLTNENEQRGSPLPAVTKILSCVAVANSAQNSVGNYFKCEIQIETGVRHQIRVHLASLGAAIIGDTVYGEKSDVDKNTELLQAKFTRLHLHASKISFEWNGRPFEFDSPYDAPL